MQGPKFEVKFLKEAAMFLDNLEVKVREKIIYNISKARHNKDKELFKKLTSEIWEFRTFYKKKYYRLFAFWDKFEKDETVVIATHGLIKKTDKTPQSDLEKAERLKRKYFGIKN